MCVRERDRDSETELRQRQRDRETELRRRQRDRAETERDRETELRRREATGGSEGAANPGSGGGRAHWTQASRHPSPET